MGNIHDVFKDDDVNGTIIGAIAQAGRLFYDGRAQSKRFYGDNNKSVIKQCLEHKKELESEGAFKFIYPLDAWEIRIDT